MRRLTFLASLCLAVSAMPQAPADPLPSWTVVDMKTDWKRIFPFDK